MSIDFVTDLPVEGDAEDSIMIVVDRATKMVHLIPCKKTTTAGEAATVILAACGQVTWSPSGNPYQSGCPICR